MTQYNPTQAEVVTTLITRYDISPDDIQFFGDQPFLGYEAMCTMMNVLCPDVTEIDLTTEPSYFSDSVTIRCSLSLRDGRKRSAVGVANCSEKSGTEPLSPQQLHYVACSRALRLALRTAGIDLWKLHIASCKDSNVSDRTVDVRTTLLAQVHVLARDLGILKHDDRQSWEWLLMARYGVTSSRELSQALLADLVAFLHSLKQG